MSLKGGYKVINFGDVAFTTGGSAVTIEGVHDAIKNNYRNVILLSGLFLDNKALPDLWAHFSASGTSFVATIPYVGVITVANTDAVTITADNSFAIPAVPSSNGTYYLKAVKSSGGVTYSWATI